MKAVAKLIFLACSLSVAFCANDFSSYPFKATLNTAESGGLYELYWKFDNAKETISFAVRVNATGWVGLGLSPNGQMPNSDVVIGWVTDGGETVFHVSVIYIIAKDSIVYTISLLFYRTGLQGEENHPQ